MLGIDLRALFVSALIASGVAVAATIVFLGVNRLSLETDEKLIAERLKESFVAEESWIDPDRTGSYNDCLLGAMAILRDYSTVELVVSGPRIYNLAPPWSVCEGLRLIVLADRLDRSVLDPEQYVTILYHQYWTGQRTLLSFALSVMDTQDYRWILYGLSYGVLLLGVAVAGARLARHWPLSRIPAAASDAEKQRIFADFAILALLLAYLLFLDLPTQGASFDTAPPYILISGLAVSALFVNYAALSTGARALILGAFGAIIAYFALLTGSALLGLTTIIVILSLQRPSADQPTVALNPLLDGVAAYCAGFVGCIVLKIIAVELLLDIGMIERFIDLLIYRMTGDERTTFEDPRLRHLFEERDLTVFVMAKRIGGFGARFLGFGSLPLGLIIGGVSIGVVGVTAAAALRHWRRLRDPVQVLGLLGCTASLALWYVVFMQHTAQHPGQMSRCLAPLVAVAAMFAIAIWLRMPTPFIEIRNTVTLARRRRA